MQLDQITANIRTRNPWEAMDLGFALIRHSWRDIYLPWFIFLTLVSIICFFVIPEDYRMYSLFIVWWLKPLFDRFLLNILSHKLFNEHLSTTESLQAIPNLVKNTGLLGGLTFRRPSFSRGFNLPVWQLEQLRGKPRADRQEILLRNAHSHALGLTIGMIFIELALYFSIYALIILFLPERFQSTTVGLFFSDNLGEEVAAWLHIMDHVIYTLTVFLIEPFYIAASFTLYINRRTQLEAWDIELVFRQLASRLKKLGRKTVALILLPFMVFAITATSSNPVHAASEETETITNQSNAIEETADEFLSEHRLPAEKSAEIIAEIMQRKELSNEKTNKRWVKIKKEKKKKKESSWNLDWLFKPFIAIISIIFESSLWIALAIGILFLFLTRKSWLPLFYINKQEIVDYEAPKVMFGMDIRPESLPDNIPEAARKLWQAHKHRDALSLLYRGALAQLVTIEQLNLKSSQTEGDILKLGKQALLPVQHLYLKQLTWQWKQIAYAHHLPDEQDMNVLFDHWETHFSKVQSTAKKNQVNMKEGTHE